MSEEHRRKIGLANKGNKRPDLVKRNKSLWMRKKVSKAKTGKKRPDFAGSNHWKWNGGRTTSANYILISAKDHPYANRHGYVMEHRLAMERKIGRFLKPKEEVHHINGKRGDNRIENLVLFANKSAHMKHHHSKKTIKLHHKRDPKTGRFTKT